MAMPSNSFSGSWSPTEFIRVEDGPFDTSMGTAKIKTNATYGFLKAMGNRQGPHALACEYVGSSLAKLFGLTVPDFAILSLEDIDCFPLPRNAHIAPGPAFVSRAVAGRTWGMSEKELQGLENPNDITRLVIFDNWIRNCDRHPPDLETRRPNYANVFLGKTDRPEYDRLYAIDHTHCFDCGRDLTGKLDAIGNIRDHRVYGLFPQFEEWITHAELWWCKASLESLQKEDVQGIVDRIPREWEVSENAKSDLVAFVLKRAAYLASRIEKGWGSEFWTEEE